MLEDLIRTVQRFIVFLTLVLAESATGIATFTDAAGVPARSQFVPETVSPYA